jgi:hypothetical protein
MIGWGYMTEALIPVSGFPLNELNVCRLCRDAVPTLPRYSGCDVIASLPGSADNEGEESEDQDDDDDEAAAAWADRVDLGADLVPEFLIGVHGISYGIMPR